MGRYKITIPAEITVKAGIGVEQMRGYVRALVMRLATSAAANPWATARTFFLWSMLLVAVGYAGAQTEWINMSDPSAPPQPPVVAYPTGEAVRDMANAVISTVDSAFSAAKDRLSGTGSNLTYFLFAIVFTWAMVKAMIQGDGINAIIAEVIPLAVTLFLIELLILQGGAAGLVGYLDSIAAQFGGTGGGLRGDLTGGVQAGLVAIGNILSMPSRNTEVTFSFDAIGQIIASLVQLLFAAIGKLLASAIIIVATGIYIGNVVLAHGSIMLALALAPIMVPWLIVPALSWIFDSWLKFTIGAGMIKIVGAFMLALTSALMNGMANISTQIRVPPNADLLTLTAVHTVMYFGLALVAFLAAYLAMQVPGLASGLISGSAKGAGFGGLRPLTQGVGFGAINAGAAAGGRAASSAAGAASGTVKGLWAARQSTSPQPSHPGHVEPRSARMAQARGQTPQQAYGRAGAIAYRAAGGVMHEKKIREP